MAISITIAGVDRTSLLAKESLRISKRGDGNNTISFSINTTISTFNPKAGMEVLVYDGVPLVVGGIIKTVFKQRITPEWGNTTDIICSISADGYNEIPSRRTCTCEYFDMTAGEIVEALRALTIDGEGVGAGTIDAGITIPYYLAVCKSLKEIYDDLAKNSGYKWYIDGSKDLCFLAEDAIVDATEDIVEGGTFTDFNHVAISESLTDYRNKTFVKGNFGPDGKFVYVDVEDAAEIAARIVVEGAGTGVYGHVIEAEEITDEADAISLAELDLQKNSFEPADLSFTSYTTSWVVGTRLKVNLPSLGLSVDTYFLITEVLLTRVKTDILQATVKGRKRKSGADFSTQKVETGTDYFVELARKSRSNSSGNLSNIISQGVKSYYDTNDTQITVTTAGTLVCEKTFNMQVGSNIFIAFSCKLETEQDQKVTAITYLDEGGYEISLDYSPEQYYWYLEYDDNIHLFTYTDTAEGIAENEITISIKLKTDVGGVTVPQLGASLSILTIPALSVVIPDPGDPIGPYQLWDDYPHSEPVLTETYPYQCVYIDPQDSHLYLMVCANPLVLYTDAVGGDAGAFYWISKSTLFRYEPDGATKWKLKDQRGGSFYWGTGLNTANMNDNIKECNDNIDRLNDRRDLVRFAQTRQRTPWV